METVILLSMFGFIFYLFYAHVLLISKMSTPKPFLVFTLFSTDMKPRVLKALIKFSFKS